MNRRFNYTGRLRIEREQVAISLTRSDSQPARFEARLDISSLELPPDSLVFVEAYRQATNQRFAFGSFGQPSTPASTLLTEFSDPSGVMFRVKVVGTGDRKGHLLAEADRILPKNPGDSEGRRRSLLPVAADDLQGDVWRLEIEDGDPLLLIERSLGDPVAIARDPGFASLVFPAVIQLILREMLSSDEYDPEEPNGWHADWLRFASYIVPGMSPPAPNEPDEGWGWIRAVSRGFCRQHALVARLLDRWEKEAR